jgi:hypothetical protein
MTTRRNFILGLSAFGGLCIGGYHPLRKLLASIMNSKGEKSGLSRLTLQECRNYVQFNHYGGPSRWLLDSILKPTDDHIFNHHSMMVNRVNSINNNSNHPVELGYEFVKSKKYNLPYLWKFDIPTASGKKVPMTNLLDHMLTVRGVNLEGTVGHPFNCAKMVAPSIGGLSIDGLLADKASTPIPAISVGNTPANRAFKSKSSSVVRINSSEENYLKYLLDPFYYDGEQPLKNNEEINTIVDEAIDALKVTKGVGSKQTKILYSDLKMAKKLFRESIDGFLAEYDVLVKKYSLLITTALGTSLEGINTEILPGAKLPFTQTGDVKAFESLGRYLVDSVYLMDSDIRGILNKAKIAHMAQEFAIAEYTIRNGLSTSVLISTENEMGNMFTNTSSLKCVEEANIIRTFNKELNQTTFSFDKEKVSKRELLLSLDSHGTGQITNFFTTSMYFYAITPCLNELIESFKKTKIENKSLFDESLIHFTAEFDRTPKEFLNGSGHNEQAHVSSFFSGVIKEHTLLGDIFTEASSGGEYEDQDCGTIGNGAPVASFNNDRIGISNLSSSISNILRVKKIVSRADPIFDVKNGKLKSLIDGPRNVEGIFSEYLKSIV